MSVLVTLSSWKTLKYRNEWPIGRIMNAIPSEDSKVRKVELCVVKNGKRTVYTPPVTKLVLLTGCSQK